MHLCSTRPIRHTHFYVLCSLCIYSCLCVIGQGQRELAAGMIYRILQANTAQTVSESWYVSYWTVTTLRETSCDQLQRFCQHIAYGHLQKKLGETFVGHSVGILIPVDHENCISRADFSDFPWALLVPCCDGKQNLFYQQTIFGFNL